ncbi:tetratricopeptide repeat protein [Occallatibacter riparius]|uniref:Tetratricopeptide repeat protein n=1 Tax=Occallatibacter riparius TaxID=1002689 RepID=A0A9J7BS38_9BACT|nr:tetratricopeptide repeat protein [Occallatibacter riparius]UWZ85480.1 tetratricopeptide repeat protein [Occallatibacter riparius]
MNRIRFHRASLGAACLLLTSLVASAQTAANNTSQTPSATVQIQREMNLGVAAYNKADYDMAVEHFQAALRLDPRMTTARAYLGIAVGRTITPALETPDNLRVGKRAIRLLQQVLAIEPDNLICREALARAYFDINELEEAREWSLNTLDLDALNPDAAYIIGVVDWMKARDNALDVLRSAGTYDDGKGNEDVRVDILEEIRVRNADVLDEAERYLKIAVENRENFEDAMRYLALVDRRKADLEYGSRNESELRDNDLAGYKQWVGKAMEVRNANSRKLANAKRPAIQNLRECVVFRNLMAPAQCVPPRVQPWPEEKQP